MKSRHGESGTSPAERFQVLEKFGKPSKECAELSSADNYQVTKKHSSIISKLMT